MIEMKVSKLKKKKLKIRNSWNQNEKKIQFARVCTELRLKYQKGNARIYQNC